MNKETIGTYIKRLVLESGVIGKLIAASTVVFLVFLIINIGEVFFTSPVFVDETTASGVTFQVKQPGITLQIKRYLMAPSSFTSLLYRPWTAITHLFTHGDFGHYLFNMLALFLSGRIFTNFFSQRRLLLTYFVGGVFAYAFYAIAHSTIPYFVNQGPGLYLGASGAIMAIFIAAAVHQPNFKINLFGVFQIPLILIAGLYIISDLAGIGTVSKTAFMGHLGGALFGGLSVINAHGSKNIMNRIDRFIFKLKLDGISFKSKKPKMKMYTNTGSTDTSKMTDDEYNASKAARQEKVDAILEKISKKGYEGLTKTEKDILFNESKRG